MEKVGKRGIAIAAIIIVMSGIYMQYGREMSVVASYVTMQGEMCENDLSICLNKVWNDKEQGAIEDEILKRYAENSFRNIRFSQGMDKTELLRVDVYLNRRERKKGKEMFHFEYYPCLPEVLETAVPTRIVGMPGATVPNRAVGRPGKRSWAELFMDGESLWDFDVYVMTYHNI